MLNRLTREEIENKLVEILNRLENKEITPRQAEVYFKGLKVALENLEKFEQGATASYRNPEIKIEIITRSSQTENNN